MQSCSRLPSETGRELRPTEPTVVLHPHYPFLFFFKNYPGTTEFGALPEYDSLTKSNTWSFSSEPVKTLECKKPEYVKMNSYKL